MTTRLKFILSLLVSVFAFSVFAVDNDAQVESLKKIFEAPKALHFDQIAVDGAANEWQQEIELVTLKGKTKAALDKAWVELTDAEDKAFLATLRERYEDDFPTKAKSIADASMSKFAKEMEFTLFAQSGMNDEAIKTWLLDEVLTPSTKAKAQKILGTKTELDFARLHTHDTNAEILGDDVLLIRGNQKVLIVRMSYQHA